MDTARLIEFVGNHPFLFTALAATVGFIAYTEYMRMASGVKGLSPYQATQMMNDGKTIFVDVRDDTEFKKGHVLDATNIPLGSLDNRLHELDKFKDQEMIVYCDSGMRAQRAGAKLRKGGFSNLHTITGGLAAWEKASLPLVTK